MQLSGKPAKLTLPFAASGGKNTIPVASQIGITAGAASYTDGFPPLTRTPIAAGGVPPFGQDMNGALFQGTSALERWFSAGAAFPYDSAFAADTNVGGYPMGSRVLRSDGSGYWISLIDNNANDPEATTAYWLPTDRQGVTSVVMSSSNVTLTNLQAAKKVIVITGALTANINLIFPVWTGVDWSVVNNTTGAFSVTCKTSSGTGISIATGTATNVYCDGTNISNSSAVVSSSGISGARKNLKISYTGTSAVVNVTADELSLENASNQYITLRSVSISASSGSASGVANSLDSGAWAFGTFYNLFVIYNPSTFTPGLLWSLSATSPTLPSGYTYFARIGANKTQSATNYYFLGGSQNNEVFEYRVASGSNVTSLPTMSSGSQGNVTTPTWLAVPVGGYVPPTATAIDVVMAGAYGSGIIVMAAPNNSYGAYNSAGNPPPLMYCNPVITLLPNASSRVMTLESSNIYFASTSSNALLQCGGWKDNL